MLGALPGQPRSLIGYSDLTALHAIWDRVDVLIVHGHIVSGTYLTLSKRGIGFPKSLAKIRALLRRSAGELGTGTSGVITLEGGQ